MASDMGGLLGAVPMVSPIQVPDMHGVRQDMLNIRYPIIGEPASRYLNFKSPGFPLAARDPNLTAADPLTIPDLVQWHKASDFDNIADGTEVTMWLDHSSLGRHANAIGGAGNRQTVSRNSINGSMTTIGGTAKRGFNTSLGSIDGAALTSKNIWTFFAVVSFSSLNAASENNCMGFNNTVGPVRMGINNTGPGDLNLVYPNIGGFRSTTALTVTTFHYIIFENDNDTEALYLDGSTLTFASAPGTVSGNAPRNIFLLDDGNTGPFRGLCAEIGVYNRAITSAERSTLYTYFQQRYKLP